MAHNCIQEMLFATIGSDYYIKPDKATFELLEYNRYIKTSAVIRNRSANRFAWALLIDRLPLRTLDTTA